MPVFSESDTGFANNPEYIEQHTNQQLIDAKKKEEADSYREFAWQCVQLLDPTGASSYPELATSFEKATKSNKSEDWLNAGITAIGALPLIGKVTAPTKLAKIAERFAKTNPKLYNKIYKYLEKGNEVIDTPQELIPAAKKLAKKTQDATSELITNKIMAPIANSNISNSAKLAAAYGTNWGVNVVNGLNNLTDVYQIWEAGKISPNYVTDHVLDTLNKTSDIQTGGLR